MKLPFFATLAIFVPLAAFAADHAAADNAAGHHGSAKAGDISIEQPWARESPAMAQAGAAFMTLTNTGDNADRLVSASSPIADKVELHTHIDDNGVMRMRAVEGIDVPAKQSTALKPGGLHVMLIGLKAPLKQGTAVPLTLTFQHGGQVALEVPVGAPGAMVSPVHAQGGHPLFINLTSDDSERVAMALGFSKAQLERGHPVTIWLNNNGVNIASKQNATAFGKQQQMISDLIAKGAAFIICPTCMQAHNIKDDDLLAGISKGNPALTEAALFREHTQTLSW